jgi:hypothetical protein
MKKTINNLVIVTALLMILCSNIFAQGNFTTEWESPAGWSFSGIAKLDVSTNVYHLAFADVNNEHNIRIYNGSTHNTDYSWTWSGAFQYFDFRGIRGIDYGSAFSTNQFDVNGDGINECIQQFGSDPEQIINPVNGNSIYSTSGINSRIQEIIDIDGDGFLELIEITGIGTTKIVSTSAQTVSVDNQNEIIKDYELKQNYPNPFNPNTTIEYNLNKNSEVKVIIYDILGKEISTLVNEKQNTGKYKLNLNGSGLSSGTYFYSIVVDGLTDTKKMILVK